MQLISMNALCDNDSTLEKEERRFSGPTRPPKPSCSFPSLGCRVLGSGVPVPTRLDQPPWSYLGLRYPKAYSGGRARHWRCVCDIWGENVFHEICLLKSSKHHDDYAWLEHGAVRCHWARADLQSSGQIQ